MNSVKEFVTETGGEIPTTARPFNRNRLTFLAQMVTSEMVELLQTVMTGEEAKQTIIEGVSVDYGDATQPETTEQIIGEQADALIDAMYYMFDMTLRQGINLDDFFGEIHAANMRKRFPDGTFHKREDGKVLKPIEHGWYGPDVAAEALRQMENNELN